MSQQRWVFSWLVIVLGLAASSGGCDAPPPLVDAVPPGVDQRAVLADKKKEKDDPQALGEAGVAGKGAKKEPLPDLTPAPPTAKGETKTTKAGVKYTTIKEGTGPEAKAGQVVRVHYVGTLDDGRVFDSSRKRGEPGKFTIGTGDVIRGWDESVPGMKVGEIRKIDVPAASGYGALGKGEIPPNADLHFEIELVGVDAG